MDLIIKDKANNNEDLIREVMKLDIMGYPAHMQGTFDTIYERFKQNEESFILAYDKDNLVGYLCFFPISDNLLNKMYKDNNIYDTDILPEDIREYDNGGIYNLFIISIVVHPDYQGSKVIKCIAAAFVKKIELINNRGNIIGKIVATAVSDKGRNCLEKLNFTSIRVLNKGYLLMECSIKDLQYFDRRKCNE